MSSLPPSMTPHSSASQTFANQKHGPTKAFQTAQLDEWQPASLFKRYIASIIDTVIGAIFVNLLRIFFVSIFFKNQILAGLVLSICYLTIYWVMIPIEFGATPGKKAMGLRIINNDGNLNLGYGQMICRESICRLISMASLLGYLWVFFGKEKRAWHDIMSKTKVVQYR